MLRRSILPKAQDMRIDVGLFDEETGEFFTACSQRLVPRFADTRWAQIGSSIRACGMIGARPVSPQPHRKIHDCPKCRKPHSIFPVDKPAKLYKNAATIGPCTFSGVLNVTLNLSNPPVGKENRMKHIGKLVVIFCGFLLLSPLSLEAQSSGIAPQFTRRGPVLRSETRRPEPLAGLAVPCNPSRPPKQLAVSDFALGDVDIFYGDFSSSQGIYSTSTITTGMNGPDGIWYDQSGNLYVANYVGVNVQEYAPCTNSPFFTYSAGLVDPVNVTTDKNGNVYVADYAGKFVAEYFQGTHAMKHQCYPGGQVEGVAVDKNGNVFISYNGSDFVGHIAEYAGGLAGCNITVFPVTLGFAGGLQIDNSGNLAACDQFGAVDIIPPPFATISRTITGAIDPFHIALNRANTLIFIADPASGLVLVATYPGGSIIETLGLADNIEDAAGVAAYQ